MWDKFEKKFVYLNANEGNLMLRFVPTKVMFTQMYKRGIFPWEYRTIWFESKYSSVYKS